ncbi:type I toxin-antitoxin system ptaRNA1 family toxin [Pusillimonas sp.]|uniref:type I toxin-antitoxin system ptaRNA1 family toxin n=1 Tax=Pusillimonas sp. TaxID=3040095 RepID=UPI0037C95D20
MTIHQPAQRALNDFAGERFHGGVRQAETGRATRNDFCKALEAIRRSLPQA